MELSKIWVGLPTEIILAIVEETENIATLHSLCHASTAGSDIESISFRRRYAAVSINTQNIHLGTSSPAGGRGGRNTTNQPSLANHLLTPFHGIVPATLVKNLVFDLQETSQFFETPASASQGPDPSQIRKGGEDLYVEDAVLSLIHILNYTKILDRLEVRGGLTQDILDAVINNVPQGCHDLAIRAGDSLQLTLPRRNQREGLLTNNLDLSSLHQLKCIRNLSLGHLYYYEAKALAEAVSQMLDLETLKIFVKEEDNSTGAIHNFLANILGASTDRRESKFPASLKSLTLHEFWKKKAYRVRLLPVSDQDVPPKLPNLKHVSVDLPSTGPVRTTLPLFGWFKNSPLRDIEVPWEQLPILLAKDTGSIINGTTERLTVHSICDRVRDVRTSEANAWSLVPANFTATSLVVGTRPFEFLTKSSRSRSSQYTMPADFEEEVEAWKEILGQRGVRHLRLEQIELDTLELEHFEFHEFKELRVLMLYPWVYSEFSWDPETDNFAAPATCPSSTLPKPRTPEARLLAKILKDALKTLRLVFVGSYQIWLRDPVRSPSKRPGQSMNRVPMPLSEAKADTKERAIMDAELDQGDWQFISETPLEPAQILAPQVRRRMQGRWAAQSRETVRQRSFVRFTKQK